MAVEKLEKTPGQSASGPGGGEKKFVLPSFVIEQPNSPQAQNWWEGVANGSVAIEPAQLDAVLRLTNE